MTPEPAQPAESPEARALLPCPKCSSEGVLRVSSDGDAEWVECSACGYNGGVALTRGLAIKSWNTHPYADRATSAAQSSDVSHAKAWTVWDAEKRMAREGDWRGVAYSIAHDILPLVPEGSPDHAYQERARMQIKAADRLTAAIVAASTARPTERGAVELETIRTIAARHIEGWPFDRSRDTLRADIERALLASLATQPATGRTMGGEVENSPYVAGPSWKDDEENCFTAEVQIVGGYEVIATVHGATLEQAEQRQRAVLAALQNGGE